MQRREGNVMQADRADVTEPVQESTPVQSLSERSRHEGDCARRVLIQGGWAFPLVLAVGLIRHAKAQSGYYGGTPPPPPPD
jgi:hypothetical protein